MSHPYLDLPRPIVFGHRGCAGEAPENTLPSFRRALEQGAAILESDAHLTRDGEIVLIHDDTVDRTTDGSGSVTELELSQLLDLDAGYRFTDAERGQPVFRGRGIRVPTLEGALRAFPDVRFNLEIKAASPEAIRRTLDVVAAHERDSRTLLTVEDDASMAVLREQVRSRGSGVAIGASRGDILTFLGAAGGVGAVPQALVALQLPPSYAGRRLVGPELIQFAHAHGVQIHVFTINATDEMEALLDQGVDGIVTDYPARAVDLLARRG